MQSGKVIHGHKFRGKASPTYKIWLGMKRRCYDENYKDFPNWGGRGIQVCDRWNNSFVNFLADMGERPEGLTIDRIDPSKNYERTNCRWTPHSQQAAENSRNLRPVLVNEMNFSSIRAACRHFGVNPTAVNYRLKSGVPIEAAIATTGRLKSRRTRESYLPKNHPDRI